MYRETAGAGRGDGSGQPLRVFVLDNHELVRQGLSELLEDEGFRVVGESGSAVDAARRILALHPDLTILDGRLRDGTGIEVCREVRSADPSLRCLILSSYDDEQARRGAVLAGSSGYVLRQIRGREFMDGIRRAASGESLFEPGAEQRIIDDLCRGRTDPRVRTLTGTENQVLMLIGRGLTNRQIAQSLSLPEQTVRLHVSSIMDKLVLPG